MTHHRYAALAVAALATITSCGSAEPTNESTETGSVATAATEPAEVDEATRARARGAAFDVRTQGCGPRIGFGSGSLIGDDVIITAAHVVAGVGEVWVIDPTGTEHPVEVVAFDPLLDIAVLRGDALPGVALSLRAPARTDERGVLALPRLTTEPPGSSDAGTGEWVIDEVDVSVLRTVNIDTTDIYLDTDVTRRGFEIDGDIDPGDSGSIVVFPDGAAGVVWARSTEREGRAWTVELPESLSTPGGLDALTSAVDLGPCLK